MSKYPQRLETEKEAFPKVMQNLGIMRARVEYDNDPLKMGRIRVRVPSLHGVKDTLQYIKPKDLPWAIPCVPGGCGQDFGQMIVPAVGTWVFVFFEDNDTNKPIYMGGAPSKGGSTPRVMNKMTDEEPQRQYWETTPNATEVPKDMFEGKSSGSPERQILYKSQKGHTIIFDDTDGEEKISFVDRSGQAIEMRCPVSKADNKGNAMARGTNTAFGGKQLDKALKPSIVMRSGPSPEKNISTEYAVFQDNVSIFCSNGDTDQSTITQFTPSSFLQQTKDSLVEMLETLIRIEYPKLKTLYDDNGYYTKAFDYGWIKLQKDFAELVFKDCKIRMTPDGIEIVFKGSSIKMDNKTINIVASDTISLKAPNISVKGGSVSVEGDTLQLDGSNGITAKGEGAGFEANSSGVKISGARIDLN